MLWFNSDAVTSAQTASTHTHTLPCCVWVCVFKWNCLIRHKHIYSVEYLLNNLIWNPAPLHTHITLAVLQSRRTRTRRNNRSRQTNQVPQPQPQPQPHAIPQIDTRRALQMSAIFSIWIHSTKAKVGKQFKQRRRRGKKKRGGKKNKWKNPRKWLL